MFQWLNPQRRLIRWPLKTAFLLVLVLIVMFPRLDLLPRTIDRWADTNALVDPDSPALEPLVEEFELARNPDWTRKELMNHIEAFVYYKIPYARDWNIWLNVDYIPTVEEAIEKGREDCDGRAVVAASMLRRYGFDAILVGNFDHMWVKTEIGETLGPSGTALISHTDNGDKIDWGAIWDLPDDFAEGMSIFPLWREIIIAVGIWLILAGPKVHRRYLLLWLLPAILGLIILRDGGRSDDPENLKTWAGSLLMLGTVAGMLIQTRKSGGNRKRPAGFF